MLDTQKMLFNLTQMRKSEFVTDVLTSDVLEAYFLFRRHDGNIDIKQLNQVSFDRNLCYEDSNSLDAQISISLYPNNDCFEKCSQLLTECKQIEDYENIIKQLDKERIKFLKDKRQWHSKYLHTLQKYNSVEFLKNTETAISQGDWFALFVDDYSNDNEVTTIMQYIIPKTSDFFKSDYWTKLFTLDKRWSYTCYEPPSVTHDGLGFNPWFIICDASSRSSAIQHLRFYPDTPYHIVQSDESYMMETLDDIWFRTFGTFHS